MQLIYVYKYEHYEKWSNIVKSSCFDNEALALILRQLVIVTIVFASELLGTLK